MSAEDTFQQMWRDLTPIGRDARSGGYFRQPWHAAERELAAWFAEAAAARGLEVETDGYGNQVASWRPDGAEGPAVLTGSHLDSVLDGGAYDGPLGVVSALAAIDLLRERRVRPVRPLAVGVFVEEEGSRFGRACLGSRLATGGTDWEAASQLRDSEGIWLGDALEAVGLDPSSGAVDLSGVGCFVELHVEQGRELVHRDREVGVASAIWPHGRWRFDFSGEANHAGTTAMADRRDPMLTYAMTVLAANKQARLADQRATFGRVEATPNGTNAVPSHVRAWLDARCADDDALRGLIAEVARLAEQRADRDGTDVTVTAESVSGAVAFDPDLAARLAAGDGDRHGSDGGAPQREPWPVLATQAGHDAGILQAAGIPSAMLFVRNPIGVSHSPAEHAETADCLAGVVALADALAGLVT
jgi:N-carbamoyl-L-amino-acid hydrolase